MVPFLKKTSEFIISRFGEDLSEICIVLPNRRAGLFLRKYLAAMIGKTGWAPAIFSIEDFIAEISGLRETELLSLLFELYDIHKEIEGEKAQPFEDYLHWASQLIGDFNEIDRYMVDAQQLFSYLDEARVLSVWNLENQPLTEFEAKYLQFYHSLHAYYEQLTSRLLLKNQGYQGLIFRHAADHVHETVHELPWKQVVFAGFNALTRAEEKIIRELHLNHKAILLWDADPYYLNNEHQEAGTFLREWIRKWPSEEIRWVPDDYAGSEKEIDIVGIPDPVGEVKYCGTLLRDLALKEKNNEGTAVVLLDESLLVPLLNSLPEEVDALNITAGLPLRQTPLANLFEAIFRMHVNVNRFAYLANKGKGKYYHKDVLAVLQHPLICRLAGGPSRDAHMVFDEAIEKIRSGSKVFVGKDDLGTGMQGLFAGGLDFLDVIFLPWNGAPDVLNCFKSIIEMLRLLFPSKENGHESARPRIEPEYLYAFSKIFHQLSSLLTEYPVPLAIETIYQLFRQITESTTLPFYGEPLKGIQVMGMLETRTLDFEHVILVSCNEDLLPSGKLNPSFIPFDIKRHFELPTYRHKDAVYAYHFYRLLQRVKTATILYITEPDQLGGGDPSRFIKQIRSEMPGYNGNLKISQRLLSTPAPKGRSAPVFTMPKTGDVLDLMLKKASKGFAPTAINVYRNCPLKFYFSEIAGIREPDEAEDVIDPKVLGNAVHEALYKLFKPYVDTPLTVEAVEAMEKLTDTEVDNAFRDKYKGSDVQFGKNLLLVNVAQMLVSRFLQSQKADIADSLGNGASITVAFLEQPFEKTIGIRYGTEILEVKTKGFVDRIERRGGIWRILDYKTGVTESKQVRVNTWEELRYNADLNFGFQLLMYGYLLNSRFANPVTANAGTISLKKLNSGYAKVTVPENGGGGITDRLDAGVFSEFENVLKAILEEIYDTTIPFQQTDDTAICSRCPYVNICCR